MLTPEPLPNHFANSSLRESVLEHSFLAALLKHLWQTAPPPIEVAKPDVDDAGYDLIVECRKNVRHIQLKSRNGKRGSDRIPPGDVSLNKRLEAKLAGCVLLIICDPLDLAIKNYLWFGGPPGSSLPTLDGYEPSLRPGTKKQRGNTVDVPLRDFVVLGSDIAVVAERLFGIAQA